MGKLVIFSAPSGAGKSTIVNYLLEQNLDLKFSISATSRPSRGTEQNGVEYYFLSPDEFRQKIDNNEFLEYEEVYKDRYYGTLKSEVQRIIDNGSNVIFDVDVVGGCNIKDFYGKQALAVFVEPPSIEELRQRLIKRGTDSQDVINDRVAKAEYELTFAPKFDVVIRNEDLEKAKAEAVSVIHEFFEPMKIGIFSGSFNPIHVGHLILANYITEFTEVGEIWFLVTPQNPLKENSELIDEDLRLEMTRLALEAYPNFKCSDFEFTLPRPSYTVNTLDALSEKYPEHEFYLIIGADNWDTFHQWKDYKSILDKHHIYVYPRLDAKLTISKGLRSSVEALESPIIEISSTFIRDSIAEGKNMKAFLTESVYNYIKDKNLYQ